MNISEIELNFRNSASLIIIEGKLDFCDIFSIFKGKFEHFTLGNKRMPKI